MDKISRAALMTSALAVGTAAGAVPVTMTQRINLGDALNAGQNLGGTFDIRSLLVDSQGRPVEIDLSSARLTAFAYSDTVSSTSQTAGNYNNTGGYYFTYGVPQQGIAYYYYSYDCSSTWSYRTCYAQAAYYYYYYTSATGYVATLQRDVTTTLSDAVQDKGQLSVNGQSVDDTVATTTQGPTVTGYSYDGGGQYSAGYAEYYGSRMLYQSSIASGALDFVMDLNEANLTDLESDGLLDFAFNMLVGRASFNWIQIDVIGEQMAFVEPPVDPTDVPEPGSLALLGLGALAIGVGRRARDRRNRTA